MSVFNSVFIAAYTVGNISAILEIKRLKPRDLFHVQNHTAGQELMTSPSCILSPIAL